MKTMIVGDLHGKYELAEKALNSPYNIVFIGDYLDSFDRSVEDQVKTLRVVLEAAKTSRAVTLMGNHEASYLFDSMRCSGFSHKLYCILKYGGYFKPMQDYLKYYHWVGRYFISHAGISQCYLNTFGVTFQDVLNEGKRHPQLAFHNIGRARGGSEIGGLLWCDWYDEFRPIKYINQVVGHTAGKSIREQGENNYCIDCLDHTNQVLIIDGDNAEIGYL